VRKIVDVLEKLFQYEALWGVLKYMKIRFHSYRMKMSSGNLGIGLEST